MPKKMRKVTSRHMRRQRLTFGFMPPYTDFLSNLRLKNEEGRIYLPKGRKYSIEAGRTDERILSSPEIGLDPTGTGEYGKPKYELDEAELYQTIERLAQSNDDEAQSLASAIMTTLGYEWI